MKSKSGFSFFSKMTSSRKRHSLSNRPSFSEPVMSLNSSEIDRTIDNAAEIIEKWNTEYVSAEIFHSLFCERKREAKKFVKHVKDLQNAMDSLIKEDPNSEKLIRAQKLMQMAMKRLQHEFVQILSMNCAHLDQESFSTRSPTSVFYKDDDIWHESPSAKDSIIEVEEVSKNSITELKSIAECMIASGYAKECASAYKSIRKSIVDEAIYRLGIEKISSSKAKKMPFEVFELMIKRSIEAVKVSMKTLFNGERTLCDKVFESFFHLRESCFRYIAKEGALLLFGLPETFAVRDKKTPNPAKIFPLLDLYCTITGYFPIIESIFSFSSTSIVRSQAVITLNRLSESILSHLVDLESEIRKDSSKTMVPGGGVHLMTISAMNYLSRLSEYSSVLVNILNRSSSSSSAKTLLPKTYFNVTDSDESPASEVRVRFAWLVLVLLCKIDNKAEMYKEFSAQYLFLANNLQHVVLRVRSTNLRQILGDDWIAKHSEKVRQFARSYERLAWGPLVSICPVISTSEAMEMSPEKAKMQFERFDKCFESTCEAQSKCVVPDPKLLDEMRISIGRKVLPIYRDFYNSHRNGVMLAGTEGEWNVRYTPEDIRNHLSELFSGKGISDSQYVCTSDFCFVTRTTPTGNS